MPLSEKQRGIASKLITLLGSPEVPVLTTKELTDILTHVRKSVLTLEDIPF